MKIYRVVVRGQFADLDQETREVLRQDADAHHFLRSAFTVDGTLTYDEQLSAFNVRYEVRHSDDETNVEDLGNEAIVRTASMLNRMEVGHKRLRATVTDMSTMWD